MLDPYKDTLTRTYWLDGQPDNGPGSGCDCVAITGSGRWRDRACSQNHGFICETDNYQDPTTQSPMTTTGKGTELHDYSGQCLGWC